MSDNPGVPLVLRHGPTEIVLRDPLAIELIGYLAINWESLQMASWLEGECRLIWGGTVVHAIPTRHDAPRVRRAGTPRPAPRERPTRKTGEAALR